MIVAVLIPTVDVYIRTHLRAGAGTRWHRLRPIRTVRLRTGRAGWRNIRGKFG